MQKEYDYIIAGAGLAGLSLAMRLADPQYADKKVLIVDRVHKNVNDRTWSFWMLESDTRFAEIYHKTWSRLVFHAPGVSKYFDTAPYSYHTIRGIDFYRYALQIIEGAGHIDMILGEVGRITAIDNRVAVEVEGYSYAADYVFDSIVRKYPVEDKLFVWQHFMGWEVTMEEDVFDEEEATMMDFRMDQEEEVRFVYVLPFTRRKALVEATIFSGEIAEAPIYERILASYMSKYYPNQKYQIDTTEIGAIPMTPAPFTAAQDNVIPIGTNNGTVKPSSGYAFVRIQEECDAIMDQINNGIFKSIKRKLKFAAYDKTLLNVLLTGKVSGQKVFGDMFQYNNPVQILKFLDERTSLWEEAMFFKTLPIVPFTKAFFEEQWSSFNKKKTK